MKPLATGALLLLAALLVVLSFRTFDQVRGLRDKVDLLETRAKSPLPRLAAPPPSAPVPAPAVAERPEPAKEVATSDAPLTGVPADPGIDRAGGFLTAESTARGRKRSSPLTADQVGVELRPEQQRAIEGILESRRREQLQIDGDAAFRHRELERRYEAQIRSWLDPEQQRRFDESRKVPRPDGPLTGSAPDYIRKDPAPYDLEVEWGGEWWPARTKDVRGELTLIHYVGHGDEWHEWVGPERVRPRR